MTDAVKSILSHYSGKNVAVCTNLARILNHGRLGGTGKLVILPVDQDREHGPGRSFAVNPAAYNPEYLFRLAVEARFSALAMPLGSLQLCARDYAGDVPLILKINSNDSMAKPADYCSALTATVDQAVKLGCAGVGYTIYPGSALCNQMYEQLALLAAQVNNAGMAMVVWSYARGIGIPKIGEESGNEALDIIAYAARIAALHGADIIKVKPPKNLITPVCKNTYGDLAKDELRQRVHHVVNEAAFAGRRIVVFSGGSKKTDKDSLEEIREIAQGGGFGSIIGRNSFQRSWDDALAFLDQVFSIYEEQVKA